MNTASARVNRQTDISVSSRTPPSSDNLVISPHPTPMSTHTISSPVPLTPYRGRLMSRYPDSLGRVPLHRRGTSKTYERLEDLLREAGYKETRVFTPETDRNTRSGAERQGGTEGTVRASVGAVVDFITGLVSRGSSLSQETAPFEDNGTPSAVHAWSPAPPSSPLDHALYIKHHKSIKHVSSTTSLSRKGSSNGVPRRSYVDLSVDGSEVVHTHQVVRLRKPSHGPPQHHRRHNNHHHHQPNDYSSKSISAKTNPPNARAYLRHMASAPNIQPIVKRPSLSEASLRSHALGRERRNGARRMIILNDEDNIAESNHGPHSRSTIDYNENQAHPLPRNWIESVAKALLSGVAGASAAASDAASTRTVKTTSTRKSTALSDKSNQEERGRVPTRGTKPPLLCMQVQDVKARTCEGQVACTVVTCRSTPTSRASSRVRNAVYDDRVRAGNGGKRREGNKREHRRRGTDRDPNVLPSLARTKVENDNWTAPRQRYLAGWGTEGSAQAYPNETLSDESDEEDGDDDEEEELGLDRLLVPARRQHSIQSLRKHLRRPPLRGLGAPHPTSLRSGPTDPVEEVPTDRRAWGNASWSTSRGREWLTSQGEEGEDVYSSAAMTKSNIKWRRGLPGLAQWTISS